MVLLVSEPISQPAQSVLMLLKLRCVSWLRQGAADDGGAVLLRGWILCPQTDLSFTSERRAVLQRLLHQTPRQHSRYSGLSNVKVILTGAPNRRASPQAPHPRVVLTENLLQFPSSQEVCRALG